MEETLHRQQQQTISDLTRALSGRNVTTTTTDTHLTHARTHARTFNPAPFFLLSPFSHLASLTTDRFATC
jgi:hypothetical protein